MTQAASPLHMTPKVTILMAVYNGAPFLNAQLDSIAAQSHQNWHLVCSDDQSADNSVDTIQQFSNQHRQNVTILQGPRQGFAANFMSLIKHLPASPNHTCFADQDDIWKPDKLARALEFLDQSGPDEALYCGRQYYWHPSRPKLALSPHMRRPFTFQNALIENVAAGNTIMLNPAAAARAQNAAQLTSHVYAHDWWLYLLMTATGGTVIFDNEVPQILYRQHAHNAIGAGTGMTAQFQRKAGVLCGAFSDRIDQNLTALAEVRHLLRPEANKIREQFAAARQEGLKKRIKKLRQIAPYRQKTTGTLSFWGAASLGCI